ncbi:transposase [Streptomyces sp. NBC_01549]|nr:transposase [Streptomyces sp. NBC_01549]MCX4598144.1 transposase [Streptomyces sp. NBC_01549]
MGSKQRTYTPEFREGAVRIVIETGRPIPEVAEELGVHSGTLHSWVSRWRRNGSASSDRPTEPAPPGGRMREAERAELERLRREMSEKNNNNSCSWDSTSSTATECRPFHSRQERFRGDLHITERKINNYKASPRHGTCVRTHRSQ